ncbi:MAG: response regulator [Myxococcales bacterium]
MRALVVDDKEENLYLLQALLAGNGYAVRVAHHGAEALELASQEVPDIVISDILMPVIDGFSLCRRWRQDPRFKEVPFVFYTATYTESKDEQLALSLGADRFFIKPIEPDRFLELITGVLDEHRRGVLRGAAGRAAAPESQYLRSYNAVLIRKLEDKLVQLEEANRALADRERLTQAVLDATAALVALVGSRGELLAVNRAWSDFDAAFADARLFRLRKGDDVPGALASEPTGSALAQLREGLLDVISGARRGCEVEVPYGHPDAVRWFLVRAERVGAAGAAAVMTCLDMTARHRAQQELSESSRRKDDFLALLGHELRNPLAPIKTACHVLGALGLSDPRAERSRQVIERQVGHLARLVDDLLDVSRIVRGKLVLERRPTDLAQVVRATIDDFRQGFASRGLALEARVPESALWVLGDATRLAQLAGNLLRNAQTFTEQGGRVEVELSSDSAAGWSSLVVRDTGVGMTEETLTRVFEPFEQAPQGSARTRGGLGLGLALVKGIVSQHGGEVRASSPGLGRGSEFQVRLPLTAVRTVSPPAPEPARLEGASVVLIEDNHDAAESLREVLALAGCRVRVAYDGPSGLALTRQTAPETVLCDIGLPGGLDGYQVAQAIRGDPALRATELVALTGYGQAEDRRRAAEAGFDSHLTKPADVPTLLALVARAHADHGKAGAGRHTPREGAPG